MVAHGLVLWWLLRCLVLTKRRALGLVDLHERVLVWIEGLDGLLGIEILLPLSHLVILVAWVGRLLILLLLRILRLGISRVQFLEHASELGLHFVFKLIRHLFQLSFDFLHGGTLAL